MTELYLAGKDGEGLIKPVPSDGELYFKDIEFKFVKEQETGDVFGAAVNTFLTVISYIPRLGEVAGPVVDLVDAGLEWIEALTEHQINQKFEEYLKEEKVSLNELTTRFGSGKTFMIQKYGATWEDENEKTHTSVFLRLTPVGFGVDAESALTYALADPAKRATREFKAGFPKNLSHVGHSHDHEWSFYLTIDLDNHTLRVEKLEGAERVYKLAEAKSIALGTSLLGPFEPQQVDLGTLWKQYRSAMKLVGSIKNARFRDIMRTSQEANLRGFQQARDLETAFAQAAARSKASKLLSHLSQVLSFASAIENYVEVRNEKAEQDKQKAERKDTFDKFNESLGRIEGAMKKQLEAIDAIKDTLDEKDIALIGQLVPRAQVQERRALANTEFVSTEEFLNSRGPETTRSHHEYSAEFWFGSMRVSGKVSVSGD